ncbi:MAG: 50S ribosomal protein L22 [Bacteriovoracaceae bacterium]|jgi:large subunit ribosomal protein L22|nr:50S ribosomal protein L22 [Bacteriovoracaceae bacterium]
MSIKMKNRNFGVAPRKVRQVAALIRRKPVDEALGVLRYSPKKEIAIMLSKLINSGLAVASESEKYDLDNLVVDIVMVDEGPTLKRIQPRAQGRAFRIRKRTSHITVELKEA